MRSLTVTHLLLMLLVLVGCTTVRVSQDYDPQADLTGYGTWQWQASAQPSTGDVRVDNPLLDKRIRSAVETHLSGRGLGLVEDRPGFYLSYHLAIEQKIQSNTVHTTVGGGPYNYRWYGGVCTQTRIRQYDESRLTIDIHAVDTGDLVWRGVGAYRLRTYKTPDDAAAAAQKTVDKILGQFPPDGSQ